MLGDWTDQSRFRLQSARNLNAKAGMTIKWSRRKASRARPAIRQPPKNESYAADG